MPDPTLTDLSVLDALERRRREQHARQRAAFNALGAAQDVARSQAAWREYCDAARQLEESVSELETLIWGLRA